MASDVADYTFITPNLCDDMHGALGCLANMCLAVTGCVSAGDAWLMSNVPPILNYLSTHDGVLIIVWDEPASTGTQPFVILGSHVKANYTSSITYTHSSYLKSLEELMGVTVMTNVSTANDFSDFFDMGHFP
jgi:hypothetical protein